MSIPKMMKAAVVEKFRAPLSVREVSVPTPRSGEVLVEKDSLKFLRSKA